MRDREITNAQVLTAFKNVVAAERERMRKELQRQESAFDEVLRQLQAEVTELYGQLAEAKAELARLKAIDTAQRTERDITQPLS
jgi:phage shock protein A